MGKKNKQVDKSRKVEEAPMTGMWKVEEEAMNCNIYIES